MLYAGVFAVRGWHRSGRNWLKVSLTSKL